MLIFGSDGKEQVWIWHNDDQDFYMDKNEVIRFRVEGEVFVDQLPVPPHLKGEESSLHNKPPYAITVRLSLSSFLLVLYLQLWANWVGCVSRPPASRRDWDWFRGGLKRMRGRRASDRLDFQQFDNPFLPCSLPSRYTLIRVIQCSNNWHKLSLIS